MTSEIKIEDVKSLNTNWETFEFMSCEEQEVDTYIKKTGTAKRSKCSKVPQPPPMLTLEQIFSNLESPEMGKMVYLAHQVIAYLRYKKVKNHWPLIYNMDADERGSKITVNIFFFSRWENKTTNPNLTFNLTPTVDHIKPWYTFVQTLESVMQTDIHKRKEMMKIQTPHEYDKKCMIRSIQPIHAPNEEIVGHRTQEAATALNTWFRRQQMVQLWDASSQTYIASRTDPNGYLGINRRTWFNDMEKKNITITPTMTWQDLANIQQQIVAHEMKMQQHELHAHREACNSVTTVFESFTKYLPNSDRYWLNRAHQWDNQTWTLTRDTSRPTYLI